jgi:hypothetical protein
MREVTWERAKELLADALDQPAADRDAFLRDRCGDPALVAEVGGLLRQLEDGPDFLATPPSVLEMLGTFEQDDPRFADPRFAEALRVIARPACPFGELGVDALHALLSAMDPREYAAGDRIISQGDPGEWLLLILEGTAAARVRDAPPDRAPVGEFGPGDIVGEMSLITDEPRTADVEARSAVRALSLSVEAFHRVSESHPDVRVLLTSVVADRLGQTTYDGLGGKQIGGYRIVRCVGRGGMGIVYEATRVATGETVALKMMNHRLLYQPGAVRRFRREAATLETFEHDSIPRQHECFTAYRTQFLAMEFCAGSTLGEVIASRGALDESAVRKIIGQVAIALRYIHARGMLHRDLKPSNIMLCRSGQVKLLDFGLVKLESGRQPATAPDASRVTNAATFIGTPRYMAPEQFSHAQSDYRADFYALACVAYEALTGHPAIKSTDLFDIIREKLRFVLPPASDIGPGVTPEMHELLTLGLAYLPEKRTIDLDRLAAWADPVEVGS